MSAFEDHKEEIEHYEQMLGAHRGRLAVTLDRVTNAMVLVGQHGVYCHSHRERFAGGTRKPFADKLVPRKRFPRSYGATEHA